MDLALKNEILEIIDTLKSQKKLALARCIEENRQKTCLEYSKELNSYQPTKPMELELLSAFRAELKRLDFQPTETEKILTSIEKRRVLQTAPHLMLAQIPRMFCISWLTLIGVPEDEFSITAMFSGIPFSNSMRPGRINKKNDSVNLFPSVLQDGLAYQSIIPEKLTQTVSVLPEKLRELLPEPKVGESYTKFALIGCKNIEQKIFGKKNLIFMDTNEIILQYLLLVLQNKNHIIHKIFFDPKTQKEFLEIFPNEIMFYSPALNGKYEVMESFVLENEKLKSKTRKIILDAPENLIKELKENCLCPSMILGFLILAFLNEFKCFGSFAQVEYLPVYLEKFAKLSELKNFGGETIPASNLTTGVFPENPDLHPADIILGEKFEPNPNMLFGEILAPMKSVLFNSYFVGDQRTNDKK